MWRRHDSAAMDHFRVASIDLLDAHGAVVARGADSIDLRTQPTTHPVTDFAEVGTLSFSGTLTPRSTVRLRAAGRLHTEGVAVPVTYRATWSFHGGQAVVEGSDRSGRRRRSRRAAAYPPG